MGRDGVFDSVQLLWSQTMQRYRLKHGRYSEDRLAEEADRLREQAHKLPIGKEREELLRRARQADTVAHMTEWLTSPGLQPPK